MSQLEGHDAPDFHFQTLDGAQAAFAARDDLPAMLLAFHSGCPWCRAEMPKLGDIFRRHPDIGVRVQGITLGADTPQTARAFAEQTELPFPVGVDAGGEMRRALPVGRVPAILAINRDGVIVRVYEGWAEQLPGIVEQTLLSLARGDELPEYNLVGNGCAPD